MDAFEEKKKQSNNHSDGIKVGLTVIIVYAVEPSSVIGMTLVFFDSWI